MIIIKTNVMYKSLKVHDEKLINAIPNKKRKKKTNDVEDGIGERSTRVLVPSYDDE
ncbi:hypothetical protein Hanom_Chr14g01336411 [Helianthus anomalus]